MNKIGFLAQNNSIYEKNSKKLDKNMSFLGNGASDSVEISNQNTTEKEEKKENFFYRFLRRHGSDDPEKTTKSIIYTILTVVGISYLGNKFASKSAGLGIAFENKFLGENSLYQRGTNLLKTGLNKTLGFLKSNKVTGGFTNDVIEAFKAENRAKPVWDFARGTGQGPVAQFKITSMETLRNALFNNKNAKIIKDFSKNMEASDINQICKLLASGQKTDDIIGLFTANPKLEQEKIDLYKDIIPKIASAFQKNQDESIASMGKLVGSSRAKEFYERLLDGKTDQLEFCRDLTSQIQQAHNMNSKDKMALKNFFDEMTNNSNFREFQEVDMVDPDGGYSAIANSWWPVNWVNKVFEKLGKGDSKLAKKVYKYTKGDAGDAMLKFNLADGKMTNTALGALLAGSLVISTESITNFVNDKSGLGVLIDKNIVDSWDNIQDAPKEKKASTIAEETLGSMASWVLVNPLAFGATYALATLGRLKGNNPLSKVVGTICKPFNAGLSDAMKTAPTLHPVQYVFKAIGNILKGALNIGKSPEAKYAMSSMKIEDFLPRLKNTFVKNGGGMLRLFMFIFVFSPLFKKPIDALIHKVFGKPYNKAEEQRKKQLEEQGKQVIPELGITQNELMEKIQKNPEALKKMQNNPELTKKLQQNPKLLLDLLDGKDMNASQTSSNAKTGLSEANMKYIQNQANKAQNSRNAFNNADLNKTSSLNEQNVSNTANLFSKPNKKDKEDEQVSYDSASYVPSSAFTAKTNVSDDLQKEIDAAFKSSDKLLKRAERLL